MKFAQPYMLNWLWIVIPIAVFFSLMLSKKKKMISLFVDDNLLEKLAKDFSTSRIIFKNTLLIFVFIFSILALSRPQWGFEWQEVKREGLDILVVIDTSKSMLTKDVKPNRLERTKLAVRDLLKKLKGDRIGLIAFAGDAFLVCPLTVDYNGFLLTLEDLNVDIVPRGGTNISKAIKEAITGYDKVPSKHKAIIIVTDGDELEGDAIHAAKLAKEKGIKIYTIGIGTKEGELIQIKNEKGELEFLKDSSGNFVKSRLNESLLQKISLTTGGAYVKASGAEFGLDLIYESKLSKLEKRDIEAKMGKKYYERFQFPLFLAALLLIWETCLTRKKKIERK